MMHGRTRRRFHAPATDARLIQVAKAGAETASALTQRPAALGFLLLVTLSAAVLLGQALLGRVPFGVAGDPGDLFVALIHILLAAYLPAAYFSVLAGAQSRLRQLASQLGDGFHLPHIQAPSLGSPSRGWLAAGIIGALAAFSGPYLTEPQLQSPLAFWNPMAWNAETAWHRILGVCAGAWAGWFTYAVLESSRAVSRSAAGLGEVDLFNLDRLRPYAQQGLSNALRAAGLVSIGTLFVIDQGVTPMLIVLEVFSLVTVAVALALPLGRIRRRIRQRKRRELG